MEFDLVLIVVLFFAAAVVLFAVVKNVKDKKDVTRFFNSDTKVDKDPELKDDDV